MAIKVVGLMHAGIRIGPEDGDVDKALEIYNDLLGLQVDRKRPHIPGIPGFWANMAKGDRSQQLHIFGAKGRSPAARSRKEDPTRAHVALAVDDLEKAKAELARRNITYWTYESLVGRGSAQVFFEDGFGNMLELQQAPAPAKATKSAKKTAAKKSAAKPARRAAARKAKSPARAG